MLSPILIFIFLISGKLVDEVALAIFEDAYALYKVCVQLNIEIVTLFVSTDTTRSIYPINPPVYMVINKLEVVKPPGRFESIVKLLHVKLLFCTKRVFVPEILDIYPKNPPTLTSSATPLPVVKLILTACIINDEKFAVIPNIPRFDAAAGVISAPPITPPTKHPLGEYTCIVIGTVDTIEQVVTSGCNVVRPSDVILPIMPPAEVKYAPLILLLTTTVIGLFEVLNDTVLFVHWPP